MAAGSKPLPRQARELVDLWRDLFGRHNILNYASAIAFQTLVALFPLLLLGLALLAATGHQSVWVNEIAPTVQRQVTPPVYNAIDFTVHVVFTGKTAGVILFAVALSVWEVSRSVRACMGGMNAIYETEERRPPWRRFAVSIGLAAAIIVCLTGAAVLLTFAKGPGGDSALHWLVLVARWAGAVVLLGLAVGLLFRYAPVEPRKTRWESAGATLVVAVWLGTSIGFKYYLTSVANLKTAVGSLTVFVVMTTYFYVSSIIFMVGVQLDELLREHERHPGTGLLDLVLRGE